jgi:Fungal N-terminal domain of STAND proteins
MPVGFGFSAGDFIAALKLVGTVIDALRDSGESGTAYRELVKELYSLETALIHVKRLDGEEIPQAEIISLRQAAAQCQSTIDDFWRKVQKYQPHLGFNQAVTPAKTAYMKIRWAVCRKDDLARFKASLCGHTEAINILLNAIAMCASLAQYYSIHNLILFRHRSRISLHVRAQKQQHGTLTSMIKSSYFQCMRKLCCIADSVARYVDQPRWTFPTM